MVTAVLILHFATLWSQ